jgi:acyl-CoA dehydrogenase
MLARANDPAKKPFKQLLSENPAVLQLMSKSRIEIDACRLVVLNAAVAIDERSAKGALKEIAEAKIFVPKTTLEVIDRAIQLFGAAGVSQDTPLARMWSHARIQRIADGPDEAHMHQMGRNENRRGRLVIQEIDRQRQATAELYDKYSVKRGGITYSKL